MHESHVLLALHAPAKLDASDVLVSLRASWDVSIGIAAHDLEPEIYHAVRDNELQVAVANRELIRKIGASLESTAWMNDSAIIDHWRDLLHHEHVMDECRGLDGHCHGTGFKLIEKRLCIGCRIKLDQLIATYPPDAR